MDAFKENAEGPHSRKTLVDLLARATRPELEEAYNALGLLPEHSLLRGPETGLVMVRGRMGGGGAPFNLGETTVSRASIRLASGEIGHGYRLGTDKAAAKLAAIFDALAQDATKRQALETSLFKPVADRIAAEAHKTQQETAATKVDFFTMVRGED